DVRDEAKRAAAGARLVAHRDDVRDLVANERLREVEETREQYFGAGRSRRDGAAGIVDDLEDEEVLEGVQAAMLAAVASKRHHLRHSVIIERLDLPRFPNARRHRLGSHLAGRRDDSRRDGQAPIELLDRERRRDRWIRLKDFWLMLVQGLYEVPDRGYRL